MARPSDPHHPDRCPCPTCWAQFLAWLDRPRPNLRPSAQERRPGDDDGQETYRAWMNGAL